MTLATSITPPHTARVTRSAAAAFYRNVRFCLEQLAALHDVRERRRDFDGYAYSAFYLLEEAERHRYGGTYQRGARDFAREQTARQASQRGAFR